MKHLSILNRRTPALIFRAAILALTVFLGGPFVQSHAHAQGANLNHARTIGSRTLAYRKTGQGPLVVIVHGVGGHKEDWAGLAAALAPQHTVYAIDMLGFGGSSKSGDQITMDAGAPRTNSSHRRSPTWSPATSRGRARSWSPTPVISRNWTTRSASTGSCWSF